MEDVEKRNEMQSDQRLRTLETRVEELNQNVERVEKELNQSMERVEELLKVLVANSVLTQTEKELNAESRSNVEQHYEKQPEVVQNEGVMVLDSNGKTVGPIRLYQAKSIQSVDVCVGCDRELSKYGNLTLYNKKGKNALIKGKVCQTCGIVYCSCDFMANLRKKFEKDLFTQTEREMNAENRGDGAASWEQSEVVQNKGNVKNKGKVVQNSISIEIDSSGEKDDPVLLYIDTDLRSINYCHECGEKISKYGKLELYNEEGDSEMISGRVCGTCGMIHCSMQSLTEEMAKVLCEKFGKGLRIIYSSGVENNRRLRSLYEKANRFY